MRFTARELEILKLSSHGKLKQSQLASQLGISLSTLKHHLSRMFDKTGCDSRTELILWARENGFIDADGREDSD